MPESLPLPSLTRELIALADAGAGASELASSLREKAPGLAAQIERDGADPGLLDLWGRSSNCDASSPDTPTVRQAVLDAIGLLAGSVDMSGETVHAGLMHTYGYLLSNLKTPFGFKRERYTQTTIARGLGLKPMGLLSPRPSRGTLLSNLSELAGAIALGSTPGGALSGFDLREFPLRRITERAELADGGELLLQTDLVAFHEGTTGDYSHLLVYSLRHGDDRQRLISAFPVKHWAARRLRKRCAKVEGNPSAPIKLRYNARVPGLGETEFAGRVELRDIS